MSGPRALLRLLGLAAVLLVVLAAPAAADPARPTNVRSTITGLVPPVAGVRADIVGGDSFVRLRVDAGHTVVVLGYEKEPYLRFNADGTVEENRRSPAVSLNRSRFAGAPEDAAADPNAAPEWHRIAGGGSYEWHDHRVHWMATGVPPTPVPIEIALVVDGTATTLTGAYAGVGAPAAWPWMLVTLVVAAALTALAWHRPLLAAIGAAVAAVLGLPVAWAVAHLPAPSLNDWAGVALLVVALALGVAAGTLMRRVRATGSAVLAGAGVALLLWGARRIDVWSHAIGVTTLPMGYDRLSVVATVGAGLAAVIVGARGVLSVPTPVARTAPAQS